MSHRIPTPCAFPPALPAGLVLAAAGCAVAKPDIGVEVDHVSRYVARGAVLFDGPALAARVHGDGDAGGGR
jgi:hypothetical protein